MPSTGYFLLCILSGQPDKLTKAIDSLLRNAYAIQLLAELLPRPLGDRHLVLPADIVAVIPQQPRFLVVSQRQQSPAPTGRRILNGKNESD